jgi:hypothetical protein
MKKIEYNQKFLDKLKLIMPKWVRKKVSEITGEPYQTVCDALKTYRKNTRQKDTGGYVDKQLIYDTTVELMVKAGIPMPKQK